MEISNNGKKIMTFILAMAFVLSGIMYTPKSASAADVPKVTFLGATPVFRIQHHTFLRVQLYTDSFKSA